LRASQQESDMARKKQNVSDEFVLFNVIYEDGTRSSNRKVPSALLGGLDGDSPALAILEEQDRKIGELSGNPRARIKTIVRS
jgi:hypothetical protein